MLFGRRSPRLPPFREAVLYGMAKITLDAKWLACPLPVIRAGRIIRELTAGDTLEISATDVNTVPEFEAFCTATGHKLVKKTDEAGIFTIVIRKKN